MLLYPVLLLGATAVLAAPTCTNTTAGNNTTTIYLSSSTIAGLQLALYLENLEVNLFRSAFANITSGDTAQGISNATLDAIREAVLVCRIIILLK
jgi:hypothetical protein